ncbi:TonB-dependent receptor [Algoriphagus halophytocola]|uniref:TonB-dependent receptor n=1 Tax=Algoriphagus halophytocola TaxID=2991499 RepID=A0ABY6MLF4_9BACT|nr:MULTISPECIES: TonB-dependent receptor [unclassified Algoriphagus]UZD23212.1 TonB-dependent receptor [Algoriphagus sp. TR-M5]WBL44505.1 TonB-dependent receptor [Algoriphagus sp. TR-M9]
MSVIRLTLFISVLFLPGASEAISLMGASANRISTTFQFSSFDSLGQYVSDTTPEIQELEEVVVMDQAEMIRREEANAIQLIRQDFIRENRSGSLMKSLERIPGISMIGIGSGASKPLIRGLGFNQVMVVENGIKHEGQQWGADHGLEVDQFAADQIMIIKGPASFKYGSDAIGGVIDIRERLPPAEDGFGGSIELGTRSNNAWFGGSANLFYKRNNWFAVGRLTVADYGDFKVPTDSVFVYDFGVALHEGQVRNSAGNELDFSSRVGYLGKNFRNTLGVSRVSTKAGFFANAHGLEPRQVDSELHDRSSRDILLPFQEVRHTKVINKSSYAAGNNFLQLDLGYQRNDRKEWSQYVNHGYMPAIYPSEMLYPSDLERAFDKEVFSLNLKDELFLDRHELAFGASGEYQHNDIGGWGFLIPAFQQYSYGLYVLDKFKLTPLWQLSAALRYDHSQIHVEEYQDWFPSVDDASQATEEDYLYRAVDFQREFNSLVWSVGVNYTPGDLILKGNLGTSFRMPIAKELAANGVNYHYFRYERGNADLNPEQSLQLDLGAELKKEKWLLSFSPFINYFSNYIYLNPTAEMDVLYGAGNQVFNYTEAEVLRYGAELSVLHQLTKQLSFEFLGEFVYSEQMSGDKQGFTLPFSPPPSGIINATYKPLSKGLFSNPYFAVDFRMTAEQANIVPPEKVTPGYQLVNLRAGSGISLLGQEIQVDAQVQNLFNTRYLNHTSFYRLINLPEAGRNITLSLSYQF